MAPSQNKTDPNQTKMASNQNKMASNKTNMAPSQMIKEDIDWARREKEKSSSPRGKNRSSKYARSHSSYAETDDLIAGKAITHPTISPDKSASKKSSKYSPNSSKSETKSSRNLGSPHSNLMEGSVGLRGEQHPRRSQQGSGIYHRRDQVMHDEAHGVDENLRNGDASLHGGDASVHAGDASVHNGDEHVHDVQGDSEVDWDSCSCATCHTCQQVSKGRQTKKFFLGQGTGYPSKPLFFHRFEMKFFS